MKYFKIFLSFGIIFGILVFISFYIFKKIEKKLNPKNEKSNISSFKKPDINSVKRGKYYFVKELDCREGELIDIVSKGEDFILEIGAKWCYPCWLLKNDLEDNGKNLKGISFYYLDFDKCKNFDWVFKALNLKPMDIRSVPQIFYMEKGKVNHRSGYNSAWVQETLSSYKK